MVGKIRKIIEQVVGKGKKFAVTASERPEFGHYSTNVAFTVNEDVQSLAAKIKDEGRDVFEKVEVKGKFINFWISHSALIEELLSVLKFKKLSGVKGQVSKVNVEFISANPTGPMTMANGRGGFLGDVLANVLELAGHKVTREYYINDAGNQIKLLGESVLASLGKLTPAENHYQGAYIKEVAKEAEPRIKNTDAEEVGRLAANILLKKIQDSAKGAGIKFDVWFSEYDNLRKKGVANTLELLNEAGLVSDHDGAKWLKSSDIEDEKDRVLVKSDGQPTYFLVDTAYHHDKLVKRKFDKAIDIWGADHHGYIARLKAGVKAVGINPDKLQILVTQLVRLVENGQEVKMSKRAGEFISLDDLLKDVGADAARFFFLMHTPNSHMDFDLGLAKEKSLKNPVYYVQYAYVRCGSIIEKATGNKRQVTRIKGNWDLLKGEGDLNLMRELVKLPDILWQTAEDYQVNRLTRYAMDLAKAVHSFYEKERVIGDDKELTNARLALVAATRNILDKLFTILGISKPEKM